jgi:hypothetical protein
MEPVILYDHEGKTILMHEIGHLIGVPHIEGDKLMNSKYLGKVDKLTPFAIALARAVPPKKP